MRVGLFAGLALLALVSGCICCPVETEPPKCEDFGVPYNRDSCIYMRAYNNEDLDDCLNIQNNSLKEKCMYWVSYQADDYRMCQQITDSRYSEACIMLRARSEKNPSACELGGESWAVFCKTVIKSDVRECKKELSGKPKSLANCIKWVAVFRKNQQICEQLNTGDQKDCKQTVSDYQ